MTDGSDHNDAGSDASWLLRLSADDWVAAAANELVHAEQALQRRGYRTGVTHARRAAGMACNAVLRLAPDPTWGRSYMDHLVALSRDSTVAEAVAQAARALVEARPAAPALVTIGKPDLSAARAAEVLIAWARQRVETLRDSGVN